MPRMPSCLRMSLTVAGRRRGRARTLSGGFYGQVRRGGGTEEGTKGLTNHTEVALRRMAGALGLELGLDHVEGAGGDAGDEAAPCASWRAESGHDVRSVLGDAQDRSGLTDHAVCAFRRHPSSQSGPQATRRVCTKRPRERYAAVFGKKRRSWGMGWRARVAARLTSRVGEWGIALG